MGGCVTALAAWASGPSALASRVPWGRRHRGTRGPTRSRKRSWVRRSVHRLAKTASRSRFGAFVYTVAPLWADVGSQECTQIGENGLSEPFWVIRVHCCVVVTQPDRRGRHRSCGGGSRVRPQGGAPLGPTSHEKARSAAPMSHRMRFSVTSPPGGRGTQPPRQPAGHYGEWPNWANVLGQPPARLRGVAPGTRRPRPGARLHGKAQSGQRVSLIAHPGPGRGTIKLPVVG